MGEIVDILTQIYNTLQNPQGADMAEMTATVASIVADPSAYGAYLHIISSNSSLFHKKQATLGLQKWCYHNQETPPEVQTEIGTTLIPIIVSTTDVHLRGLMSDLLQDFETEEVSNCIIENAQTAFAEQTEDKAITAAILMKEASLEALENPEIGVFIRQILDFGIQTSNIEPFVHLFLVYAYAVCENLDEEEEDAIDAFAESEDNAYLTAYFEAVVSNMAQIAQREDNISKNTLSTLCRIINQAVEESKIFINPQSIFDAFIGLIGNEAVPTDNQILLINLIENAFSYETILSMINDVAISQILQQYLELSSVLFQESPENRLVLSNVDVFGFIDKIAEESFITEEDPDSTIEFCDILMGILSESVTEDEYMPCCLLALSYAFYRNPTYFESQIDTIVEWISAAAVSEYALTRDVAMCLVDDFATLFGGFIDDYVSQLLHACTESLQAGGDSPTEEPIKSLATVFKAASDTDSVFETAFPFLRELIDGAPTSWQMLLFQCLVWLCQHSRRSIMAEFDEVYAMMEAFLQQAVGEAASLVPSAVDCLKALSVVSPERFEPHAEEFIGSVIELLGAEDSDITTSCLRALASCASKYPGALSPLVGDLSARLIEMGSNDTTAELMAEIARKQQELQERGSTELEFTVGDEEEDDGDERVSADAIPSLALATLCSIVEPMGAEVFQQLADQMMECFGIQRRAVNEEAIDICCVAMSQFVEIVGKTHFKEVEFATRITQFAIKMLNKATSDSTAHSTVQVLISVVQHVLLHFVGTESMDTLAAPIVDVVGRFFNKNFPVFSNGARADQFYEAISNLIQELISVFGEASYEALSAFVPSLFGFLHKKEKVYQMFALPCLGCFVEFAGAQMSESELDDILTQARVQANWDVAAGIYVINQFMNCVPERVGACIEEIVAMLHQKLQNSAEKSGEQIRLVGERSAGCLGEIVHVLLQDGYDASETYPLILARMPAVVDESENTGLCRFFAWLHSHVDGDQELFARAAIRFLAMPRDEELIASPQWAEFMPHAAAAIGALPNPQDVISSECGDEVKVQRVTAFLQ